MGFVAGPRYWRRSQAVSAERIRLGVGRRSAVALFRDDVWNPHGHRDLDRESNRVARDLFPAGRKRHGAPIGAFAGCQVVASSRNERRRLAAVPPHALRWIVDGTRRRPAGRPMHDDRLVAGWALDVLSSNAGGKAFTSGVRSIPTAKPEQITFGPTEQEGTALTPDGRHMVTSMGLQQANHLDEGTGENGSSRHRVSPCCRR